LVHIVDVSPYTERDPIQDYRTVMKELEAHDPNLAKRQQILVANKIDLLGENRERLNKIEAFAGEKKLSYYAISALKKQGLPQVISAMRNALEEIAELGKSTSDA